MKIVSTIELNLPQVPGNIFSESDPYKRYRRKCFIISRPNKQTLIELVYFAGHTHREVSEIMEIPLGSVGGKINDIRRKLEKQVAEHKGSPTEKDASLIRLQSWAKHIAQERVHQPSCKS